MRFQIALGGIGPPKLRQLAAVELVDVDEILFRIGRIGLYEVGSIQSVRRRRALPNFDNRVWLRY
jgi:hypothetical protein